MKRFLLFSAWPLFLLISLFGQTHSHDYVPRVPPNIAHIPYGSFPSVAAIRAKVQGLAKPQRLGPWGAEYVVPFRDHHFFIRDLTNSITVMTYHPDAKFPEREWGHMIFGLTLNLYDACEQTREVCAGLPQSGFTYQLFLAGEDNRCEFLFSEGLGQNAGVLDYQWKCFPLESNCARVSTTSCTGAKCVQSEKQHCVSRRAAKPSLVHAEKYPLQDQAVHQESWAVTPKLIPAEFNVTTDFIRTLIGGT